MAPKLLRVAVFFIVLSIHLTAANHKHESHTGYDVLYGVVRNIVDHITKRHNSIDLSSLDPFSINHLKINLDSPSLKLKGKMENVIGTGLQYLKVTKFNVETLLYFVAVMTMTVHIPFLGIVGKHYEMVGSYGKLFDFFGNGTFSLQLSDLDVSCSAMINPFGLSDIYLNLSINEFEGKFEGLLDDEELSELLNNLFNEIVPEMIEILWKDFESDINKVIFQMVEDILNKSAAISFFTYLDIMNHK